MRVHRAGIPFDPLDRLQGHARPIGQLTLLDPKYRPCRPDLLEAMSTSGRHGCRPRLAALKAEEGQS
jgi:hypothetical protein